MTSVDRDTELRTAVFAWLDEQTRFREELTWAQLQRGFAFAGRPFALVTQRGIRRVAGLEAALAFQTTYTPPGGRAPYADAEGPDGLIRGKYQGADPQGPDNRAMRAALQRGLPLVWSSAHAAAHPAGPGAAVDVRVQRPALIDREDRHAELRAELQAAPLVA